MRVKLLSLQVLVMEIRGLPFNGSIRENLLKMSFRKYGQNWIFAEISRFVYHLLYVRANWINSSVDTAIRYKKSQKDAAQLFRGKFRFYCLCSIWCYKVFQSFVVATIFNFLFYSIFYYLNRKSLVIDKHFFRQTLIFHVTISYSRQNLHPLNLRTPLFYVKYTFFIHQMVVFSFPIHFWTFALCSLSFSPRLYAEEYILMGIWYISIATSTSQRTTTSLG